MNGTLLRPNVPPSIASVLLSVSQACVLMIPILPYRNTDTVIITYVIICLFHHDPTLCEGKEQVLSDLCCVLVLSIEVIDKNLSQLSIHLN